jgi:hypothetical protein
MICERCKRRFDSRKGSVCPSCGTENPPLTSGVLKSSTIVISAGGTEAVYRSVKEIPGPLRSKLLKSTNGLNSGTILIADRRGREEIARAVRNLPAPVQRRVARALLGHPEDGSAGRLNRAWQKALGYALGAGTVLFVWLLFQYDWF